MHDIRAIRENSETFDAALLRRGDAAMSAQVLAIDSARRAKIQAAEQAQAEQNKASKLVGAAKAAGDEAEFERLRALVAEKKAAVAQLNEDAKAEDARLTDMLARIPNLPADDVPDGTDEEDNVEVKRSGTPKSFSFTAKEHFELSGVAASMDFDTAAKISGARFVMLKGAVARIHRALAQFMIDTHVDHNGLTEVNSPVLVRDDAMYGTDKLPKFGEDSYQTTNGWWLVPTSEVPLTYSVAGEVLDSSALPIRLTAHTLCFRSEAGSAGRDRIPMKAMRSKNGCLAALRGCSKRSKFLIERLFYVLATWDSVQNGLSTLKRGCQVKMLTVKSAPFRPPVIFRRAA